MACHKWSIFVNGYCAYGDGENDGEDVDKEKLVSVETNQIERMCIVKLKHPAI